MDAPSLKRRVDYFLASPHRNREEIRSALRDISGFGPVVLFGGILRDLALLGNKEFRSDVDLVVNPHCPDRFRTHMKSVGALENRFGGYVLPIKRWKIELWILQDTWAQRAGFVRVESFNDLLNTTFFNCDAILYEIMGGRLIAKPEYFDDITEQRLEINLRENPNPVGNAVRAFRYAVEKKLTWGPKLSHFIEKILCEEGWQSLINYEWKSFRGRTIGQIEKRTLEINLRRHLEKRAHEYFQPVNKRSASQLELPFA